MAFKLSIENSKLTIWDGILYFDLMCTCRGGIPLRSALFRGLPCQWPLQPTPSSKRHWLALKELHFSMRYSPNSAALITLLWRPASRKLPSQPSA